MNDGAHQGVSAARALRTIVGGEDPPSLDEARTPEWMRRLLMSATGPGSYEGTANWCARLLLEQIDTDPTLLDYGAETEFDWDAIKAIPSWGTDTMREHVLKPSLDEVLKERGVDVTKGLDLTGFMWGWAVNAARYAAGAPPVSNPAIVTLG